MRFKNEMIAAIIALVIIGIGLNIGYDSICGFRSNCNRGINPTTYYGWPLVFREIGLYSGSKYHSMNIIISYLACFTSILGILKILSRSRKVLK